MKLGGLLTLILLLSCTSLANGAEATSAANATGLVTLQLNLNYVWVLAAAALVFLMQAGFMCLESGLARAKNSINVAIKNLADFVLAVASFWAIGFGLMFGASQAGIIGTSDFFISVDNTWRAAFFIFQVVFVGTAATIDSGAIAGRTRFGAYLLLSVLVSVLIYPLFGHWAWASLLHGEQQGWLEALGFIDFAGSSVVHSVGGWVALAGVIVIGPRLGKFDADGTPRRIQPHNMTLAYLGTFILFFGWFGFNGGSTLEAGPAIAPIILNTILAAVFGCISCATLSWFGSPFKRPEGEMIMNGLLGGLVAITAGCASVNAVGAVCIGLIAGVVVYGSCRFIEYRLKLDDVVGAIAVHGVCGAWGTLAVGIFITGANLGETSRWTQIIVQGTGVLTCFVWAFGVAYILMKMINRFSPLRVTPEDERQGLNVAEHGATSGVLDLAHAMHDATSTGNFTEGAKVEVEHGTEIGDLAQGFNHMVDTVQNALTASAKSLRQVEAQRQATAESRQQYLATTEEHVKSLLEESAEISTMTQDTARKTATMSSAVMEAAGAMQKISTSLELVTQQTDQAVCMSAEATHIVSAGTTAADILEKSAEEIGTVVEMISNIASQTNMLALNAQIEASRAGESGKGFAVVATQVKTLAKQSAEAAGSIRVQIENMQKHTSTVLTAISDVSKALAGIQGINNTVAATIEEETVNTTALSQSVTKAAENANEASKLVAQVAMSVQEISHQVKDTYTSIKQLFEEPDEALQEV
ncbi:MAG: ammonium transporter [Candidatus Tectomicrobia bacterium]